MMDGYAVRSADIATLPATLAIIGEVGRRACRSPAASAPGRRCASRPARRCRRARTSSSCRRTSRATATSVVVHAGGREAGHNVRATGADFRAGETLLLPGRRLGAREIALAAAMGHATLPVRRRPRVAVLATGDELVAPGERPGPGQIVASNHLGVGALAEAAGAEVAQIGIARDTEADLGRRLAEGGGRRHPGDDRRGVRGRPRPRGPRAGSGAASS